jgi:TPR repeat protein
MPRISPTGTARARIARFIAAACLLVTGVLLVAAVPAAQAGSSGRHGWGGDGPTVRRIMARAHRGDAHAQAILGFMFANGRGVPQSYDVAVDWYLQSAHQGDPDGQYLLGLMYDKGFGVDRNVVEAYKWLNLAAAHAPLYNREDYLRMRDAVASKMTRTQLDLAQQLALDFVPTR